MEALRFFAVAVGGLLLDLTVAWSAAHWGKLPLWVAAAAGFLVAGVLNYLLHELWTFRHGTGRLSGRRVLRYLIVQGIALTTRAGGVALLTWLLARALDHAEPILVLLLGAGISFGVSYALSRYWVFKAE